MLGDGELGNGDDAGHCSNRWSARNYRAASAEDRATFRRWMWGVIVFYTGVLLISGGVAIASYQDVGLTQLANFYAQVTTAPESNKNSSGAIRRPAKATSAWW
jgi:hypothetical protein